MKTYKKKNTYILKIFNLLIDIVFWGFLFIVLLFICRIIYSILNNIPDLSSLYNTLISATVTITLAFISYIGKLKIYLPILLHKIKQKIYHFFSWNYNPFSTIAITDFNKNNFLETEEQGRFISSAIHILKNNIQNMVLISGNSGKGKTTSIMLMLNAIAHDKELYWIFSELQNRIIYFDSVNDKDALLNYFSHTDEQKCKLIIVDNIQKYSISSMNEIMDKVENFSLRNHNDEKKILIIFLYQETARNTSLYKYIERKFFRENNNIFKLNRYVTLEVKKEQKNYFLHTEELKKHIDTIENPFFRQHVKTIFYNRKDDSIVTFLNELIFTQSINIPPNKEKLFFVLTVAIFSSFYNGYVTKKDFHFFWKKNYSLFSLYQENILIKYYTRNRVLMPFPLSRSAYIFNEELAREYRKKLINNDYYMEKSCAMAESMFLHCAESAPQKWLFFLLCSNNYCNDFPQHKRICYFENTLSAYHLQYILDIMESEISILPEKGEIFRQELGIIYIYNGEWAKAKQILYPYVQSQKMNKDIWHIQLKIIETEHGGSDEQYLEMLSCMEAECTNPIILFQIKYWREHIRMEHGDFSLDTWKEMTLELSSNDELRQLREDEHFAMRIVSDYERTYFLKGDIDFSKYKDIIFEYLHLNIKNDQNESPVEYELSRAYYIQYDILYQLGIWGYIKYGKIDSTIICTSKLTDDDTISDLLDKALDIYDLCIRKYQSEGKKKYRTLEVRRAELSLMRSGHYIEALDQYQKFKQYANQNDITVFKGYYNMQSGKGFALYADYMLRENDPGRFHEYLSTAENYFQKAQNIYEIWGNTYGAFRAELLTILVHMIQNRDHTKIIELNAVDYANEYKKKLSDLVLKYNSECQFTREAAIIEYLQHNILRMDLPMRIIRFYPIILQ